MALCLILTSLLTACRNSSDIWNDTSSLPTPTPEKVLSDQFTMVLHDAESSYDPTMEVGEEMQGLMSLSIESLFSLDDQQRPVPSLCSEYSSSEEGMVWTFRIRQDILFHDGTPLDAHKVAACLDELRDSASWNWIFRYFASYEATADDELTIRAQEGSNGYALLYAMTFPVYLRGDHIYGTGPYRLVQERYTNTLVRNGYWWQDAYDAVVSVPGIDLVPTASPTDVRDDFEYGVTSVVCTDPNSAAYVDYHCDYELWNCSTTIMDYIGFNVYHGLFSITELRVALTNIIDRKSIATELYHGYAEAAVLPASPLSSFYDETLAAQYDYDPEKFI